MTVIRIDRELKSKVPGYCLAVLSFEMKVKPTDESLKNEMLEMEKEVMERLTLETLLKQPRIMAARNGYKAFFLDRKLFLHVLRRILGVLKWML